MKPETIGLVKKMIPFIPIMFQENFMFLIKLICYAVNDIVVLRNINFNKIECVVFETISRLSII